MHPMSPLSVPCLPRQRTSLRAPGAVVLVSCYELGHQPLAVAQAAAFLRRAGFEPAALDLSVEPFDPERIARARLVCVSVPMHTAMRLGVRAVEMVRRVNTEAHVCFYGLYAALNAEWLLAHGGDSAIGGESEATLVSLAESIEAGRDPGVSGVSVRGRVVGPRLERLSFPAPARDLLPPLERYARLEHRGSHERAAYVEATRGCRHFCLHCPIPPVYGGRIFAIPAESVLDDIRRQVELGARHVTFGDPDFMNAPTHGMRIVRAMHREFPWLTFDITAKVEHVVEHRALVPDLVACGALFLVSAVESLSDTVLAHLEKGHTRADVFRAFEIVRAAGLTLRPSLVAFTPWTTLEDYLDVLEVVERLDLVGCIDSVQFTIRLLVPPGSMLLQRPAIRPHLRELDPAAFGYAWIHPDPRMDRLHRQVTDLVTASVRTGEEAWVTFHRLRALALAVAGREAPASAKALDAAARQTRAPGLTEPWFC